MSGKQALIELLCAEEVEYVFGIPGATEIHFLDALEHHAPDIHYVLGLQEAICVGIAEGYSRATGRPAFLNLHTAPGLASAMGLLHNASQGKIPLVVTVGQNDSRLLQREPHLTGDIVGMGKIYAKWSTELIHAEDLPVVIPRAFKTAMQATSGLVVVSIPQDVLTQEFDFIPSSRSMVSSTVRLHADPQAMAQAVAALAEARNPVIMVGSGVSRSGALDEIVHFAQLIGACVYQEWMSDVNFPVTHPQYLGDLDPSSPKAQEVYKDMDVLIGVGCPLFAHSSLIPAHVLLPSDPYVIHIEDNPREIGKNIFTDCDLQGDVKSTLTGLNAALEAGLSEEARRQAAQRIEEISRQKAAAVAAWRTELGQSPDTTPIPIPRMLSELERAVGPETIVVDEAWSSSAALRKTLPLTRPNSFFRSRRGGSIGAGLPLAVGVQLGLPERQVLAVVGDGSAAWSMQSLWTAARYHLPVTFVIVNNSAYRMVKLSWKAIIGDYPFTESREGIDIDEPAINFSLLAQSMGVKGERVTSADGLAEKITSALESREPHLIEVMVENTP
ncbi:MAG: thiamine pyrophosphate-binding protein [Thermoleophilia bacterium]